MGLQSERNYTYPVKLPPSIRAQAATIAQQDGTSLNYFISVAIAEKVSRLAIRAAAEEPSYSPVPELVGAGANAAARIG